METMDLTKIMFLDIETVPQTSTLAEMPEELIHLWNDKYALISKRMPEKYSDATTAAEGFSTSAGIYAEFGKIVCISIGFIFFKNKEMFFRTKSFVGSDEKELILDFNEFLGKNIPLNVVFCGHNIKEFDIPYICRRTLINGLKLPQVLQFSGKKPWEIDFLDTLELWKFGDYKNYTSLKTLTAVFGIPTPKDDIDGSQVAYVYYKEKNINRIAIYCQKDVLATAQVYLRLSGLEIIEAKNVEHLEVII